jgi:hypothetical protein
MECGVNIAVRIGCAAVVLTSWCQPFSAKAATTPTSTTVVVTVTDTHVKLSRVSVPPGLVVFDVGNRGRHRHRFQIAGNATPQLASGQTATLKIVFVRGGSYRFGSVGLPSGVLKVTPVAAAPSQGPASTGQTTTTSAQPCANPTSSTVTVTMTDKPVPDGYSFSPATIPCGTVTFVLTNNGRLGHGLELMDPRGQILPSSSTVGASQTASLTENLRYTGTYEWADIISDAFGENGIGELVVH